MIDVENVTAAYGDTDVLHGISLHVNKGEIMVIMGQSGCGKTTFLRALMGLHRPKSGTVRIGELDLTKMTDKEYAEFCRSVGVMIATALIASVGRAESFARGRDLAAWLGLVPRQSTTGDKPRLVPLERI